jgi:hypothetical protein
MVHSTLSQVIDTFFRGSLTQSIAAYFSHPQTTPASPLISRTKTPARLEVGDLLTLPGK